jgi:predicted metal-binding membrane protein
LTDRLSSGLVAVALAAVIVLCWAWIVPMARDMYGAMTGPAAWMMTSTWDGPHVALLWAMWSVMMAGMMLPSAAPMLLLYGGFERRKGGRASRTYILGSGYVLVWLLFSVGATFIQLLLRRAWLLTPMMQLGSPIATAAILLIAGLYQLTGAKTACLQVCRSPLAVLTSHWHSGAIGALGMGLEQGVYCLGCCWALMLLLFVGGVMNLAVIAALTVLVLAEKVAPAGLHVRVVTGVVLIGLGIWRLAE